MCISRLVYLNCVWRMMNRVELLTWRVIYEHAVMLSFCGWFVSGAIREENMRTANIAAGVSACIVVAFVILFALYVYIRWAAYLITLNDIVVKSKTVLYDKYDRYLYKTSAIMFIILRAIEWAKFHVSGTIIDRFSLFVHVIFLLLAHTARAMGQMKNKYHSQISPLV